MPTGIAIVGWVGCIKAIKIQLKGVVKSDNINNWSQ